MLAIPLLVSYDLKLDNRFLVRFATGAVWLLNPWLDSKISIDGQFDAGNDSLLYQRSESWVFPFSALNFMSKAEFIFPLKGRGELTMGFIYQQGFNQTLRQTRFSYSFFLPIYDQRIVWVNRGDMIGLSLGIMLPIRSKNARKSAH